MFKVITDVIYDHIKAFSKEKQLWENWPDGTQTAPNARSLSYAYVLMVDKTQQDIKLVCINVLWAENADRKCPGSLISPIFYGCVKYAVSNPPINFQASIFFIFKDTPE